MNDESLTPEETPENLPIEPTGTELEAPVEEPSLDVEELENIEPIAETETIEEPVAESPLFEETPPPTAETKKKMPKWLRNLIIWAVVIGLVFISGLIIMQITVAAPLRNNLQHITQENINLQAEIEDLEDTLATTEDQLTDTKSELQDTKKSLNDTHEMLLNLENSRIEQNSLLNLKYNIAMARIAADKKDTLSLRQSLLLVEANLESLEPYLDQEVFEIFQERMDDINKNKTNFTKTADALRMLSENLERFD